MRQGADTGPVVAPGDPDESPLIQAIRYDDVVRMPPKGKLPDQAIADLTAWVRGGAAWPEGLKGHQAGAPAVPTAGAAASHWAFQPVGSPAIPEVRDRDWPTSPIDRFILAGLEGRGLRPSPPADRRTLMRRATFDLTGLPPTPEEVEAFAADPSPDAFARVVDRLLASPRYGERWGRHWLDVARYADTKGYVYSDREEGRFPFAYTYRDYVIRAFNEDKPYDRFLVEQLAADCLGAEADRSSLAALGFLTLGKRFLGNPHDIIDDRIDVVFRGTQALTVGCARCHDHKFDPIPTEDYYSLYGVFAGTSETTLPIADEPEPTPAYLAYAEELRKREQALADALEARRAELSDRVRAKVAEYLEAVLEAGKQPGDEHYVILSPDDLNPLIVRRWQAYLLQARGQAHPIFAPWHAFDSLPEAKFASEAPALAVRFAANEEPAVRLNPLVARAFSGPPPASMSEVARRYGSLLSEAHRRWQAAVCEAECTGESPPTALADEDWEALRRVLYADDAPTTVPPIHINQIEGYFDEKARVALGQLQMKVDQWHLESPASTPHALALVDTPVQGDPRVFVRGNPKMKGASVPRRFPAALSGEDRRPFRRGSGRLDLAEAIASPDNPLTARVMVNRVWMHHFGQGLVRTPSDFGTRGEPPTHPELFDDLARRFVEDGWSIKSLHRLILLSQTYQQQSLDDPEARAVDPENRLLWRMNRRRLDWEALRDALLATSGRLDAAMGGRPVRLTQPPFSPRRTVYGLIDRQDLPGIFRIFNIASPDQHTPQRHATTVPQQALFLMNSPVVVGIARELADRTEIRSISDPGGRLRELYRLVLQRPPTATELAVGLEFLSAPQLEPPSRQPPPPPAWRYGLGEYDEAGRRLVRFEPLGHWAGDAWQVGPALPDSRAGSLRLTREGGHPGKGAGQAAVRRWVAPRSGVVAISGKVRHEGQKGDGVLAAILSGRSGELGRWEVRDGEAEAKFDRVEIEAGDTIDFVVISRSDDEGDAFAWAPAIRMVEPSSEGDQGEWKAADGFAGPPPEPPNPLTAWEEYVQALLLSNEFSFVD
jgi:hypothetical protein